MNKSFTGIPSTDIIENLHRWWQGEPWVGLPIYADEANTSTYTFTEDSQNLILSGVGGKDAGSVRELTLNLGIPKLTYTIKITFSEGGVVKYKSTLEDDSNGTATYSSEQTLSKSGSNLLGGNDADYGFDVIWVDDTEVYDVGDKFYVEIYLVRTIRKINKGERLPILRDNQLPCVVLGMFERTRVRLENEFHGFVADMNQKYRIYSVNIWYLLHTRSADDEFITASGFDLVDGLIQKACRDLAVEDNPLDGYLDDLSAPRPEITQGGVTQYWENREGVFLDIEFAIPKDFSISI